MCELPKLKYASIDVEFMAIERLNLPFYKGSTLRGAFGWAFKKAVCVTREYNCGACPIYDKCVYPYVFETPAINSDGVPQKVPYAPHPFVLVPPPPDSSEILPGESIRFGLTLIGNAVPFLPHFLLALDIMAKSGLGKERRKLTLVRTFQGDALLSAGTRLLKEPKVKNLDEFNSPIERVNVLKLRFISPLKLISKGKIVRQPDMETLLRSTRRRLRWLTLFHSETPWDAEKACPLEGAERIKLVHSEIRDFEVVRYSNRKRRRMEFKGIIGEAIYEGPITSFIPLLRAAEVIHIGKATSFGFGKVEIEPLNTKQ